MFSDETRVSISSHNKRLHEYRPHGERFANCCVVRADSYGGGSEMFWGSIKFDHKNKLLPIDGTITAEKYVNYILHPESFPILPPIAR